MMLHELEAVIPSFVARVERPDRGEQWSEFLSMRSERARTAVKKLALDRETHVADPSVRLMSFDGTESELLAAMLFESSNQSEDRIRQRVDELNEKQLSDWILRLAGGRDNRRHRPNRGFEKLRYRFEVVSDYGAFRDLQRHRMLTVQWQGLTPDLGASVPDEVDQAGLGDDYRRALDVSRVEFHRLDGAGLGWAAPYALCMGFRVRFILEMDAREAMHLIELRSSPQGHQSYRFIAQEMHRLIAEVHPNVAEVMTFVDSTPADVRARPVDIPDADQGQLLFGDGSGVSVGAV